MPSHASHTRRPWSLLALAAATVVSALMPAGVHAADTVVVPDLPAVPAELSTDTEGEVISSSIVRRSAMFAVHSAQIRHGHLTIAGSVAPGITGQVRGVARYRGGRHRFVTRVDGRGTISIHKRLPGGKEAQTARVTLVYAGSGLFKKQRVTLKVRTSHRGRAVAADVATLGS